MKFKLYDMSDQSVIAQGNCQRVGTCGSDIKYTVNGRSHVSAVDLPDHGAALQEVLELLSSGETKVISGADDISAVGHRVVFGGAQYMQSVFAGEDVIRSIEGYAPIAPLHNPVQAGCIRFCKEIFGENVQMAAVFDTAFHHTQPQKAFMYAIPFEYYEHHGVRRYGFHGLSYQFVTDRYDEISGGLLSREKIVACHLGGGASAAAIMHGKSIDSSFGFGSGEGIPCGTRVGTFDHSAIGFLMEKTGNTYDEIEDMLNKKSGLLGLSGISSDQLKIEREVIGFGHRRGMLALEVMAYTVKKCIGAYAFAMNGLDTIIFTGGIGENSDFMRELVCRDLENLGIVLDKQANKKHNRTEYLISSAGSKVKIWIIPTNEELVIARDTYKLMQESPVNN